MSVSAELKAALTSTGMVTHCRIMRMSERFRGRHVRL